MGTAEHKQEAPTKVTIAVLTLSTTRTIKEDTSGRIDISIMPADSVVKYTETLDAVGANIIPDDAATITMTVREITESLEPQVLMMTGGTGITPQDVTIEAVRPLFSKELTAFSVLFAQLSFDQIEAELSFLASAAH